MGTQNDTIELNGYRYDVRTGARLGRVGSEVKTKTPQRSVDGFVNAAQAARVLTPKKPVPSKDVHSKVTKSKTLRRQGLPKPSSTVKSEITKASPIRSAKIQADPARLSRAAQAQKSPHVAKFQARTSSNIEIKPAPSPVQQTQSDVDSPKKSVLPLSPFDMALQNANSHEQRSPTKLTLKERTSKKLHLSTRALSVGLGILIVLLVGGFLAQQHMSTLAVQLAATRAGVEARLPSYRPAGFSLAGPVEYSAGQIALSYKSNSDSRNFKIVQKNSDWNSQALLENFVQEDKKQFQTVQDKGKTIYIYDGTNATWVSGGVWYQVEGESSLNTDQLLRIASGL